MVIGHCLGQRVFMSSAGGSRPDVSAYANTGESFAASRPTYLNCHSDVNDGNLAMEGDKIAASSLMGSSGVWINRGADGDGVRF